MPLANILAAVRTEVAAATDTPASQVHDGVRWAANEAEFRALFRDAGNSRAHAWMVTWDGASEEYVTGSMTNLSRSRHRIRIVGVYALDDPGSGTSMTTEVAFRTIVENVRDQLRGNFTLTSTCEQATAPECTVFEARTIRGVLCHYAEIELEAVERQSYTA